MCSIYYHCIKQNIGGGPPREAEARDAAEPPVTLVNTLNPHVDDPP